MIPPTKNFDIFPPDWGMLRRSRCDQFFFKTHTHTHRRTQLTIVTNIIECVSVATALILSFHFLRCVQLGQSFKMVGYGCISCRGDVGAGDAEADVIL